MASVAHPPRILIISEVCLHREGLVLGLSHHVSLKVVGAADGANAVTRIAELRPDVVLLDAGFPDGLRALPRLAKTLVPGIRIIIFGLGHADADLLAWAEAGASGYVGRTASTEDLVATVHRSLCGELACSPRQAALLLGRIGELSADRGCGAGAPEAGLTQREREVVRLINDGLANKDIARRLGISPGTVKNHVHRILEKLQARGRGEAAARLRREQPDFGPAWEQERSRQG